MSAEVEGRKRGTAALFSRAAEIYDRVGPRSFSFFGRRLVELTPLNEGANVLDVAAGRGAVLFHAAEKVGPQGQVTGIDLAEGMVQHTAAELAERGITNARMIQMDAEQLDFPDTSFDFVFCAFGLPFFPQLSKAVAEIYRVLKPGGMLAASTAGLPDARWDWVTEVGLRPKPGGGGRSPVHEGNTSWLETALVEAHFSDYRMQEEAMDYTFTGPDEWWALQWSHGARTFLERMTPEALEEAKAATYARIEAMQQSSDLNCIYRAMFSFATKPRN